MDEGVPNYENPQGLGITLILALPIIFELLSVVIEEFIPKSGLL